MSALTAAAVKAEAAAVGFDACGIAAAAPVDDRDRDIYRRWLADGRNGCMTWAERHCDVRNDPRLLLDGARSVIVVAMNYFPHSFQPPEAAQVAYYAYGRDYHEVVRERLVALGQWLVGQDASATVRACVDTAPLRERYWAVKAGLGFIGRNGTLIVNGVGSFCFLGVLLTTATLEPDSPCEHSCGGCDACVKACPAHALRGDGSLDAQRCLSCLTIENRDPLPDWALEAMQRRVFGCDTCQAVCPHNAAAVPHHTPDFDPTAAVMSLTAEGILQMTPSQFRHTFAHSAIARARLAGLQRNAAALARNWVSKTT